MAFNLQMRVDASDLCDKCKKPASPERPVVDMWLTGRHRDERQFIKVHDDCLTKAIKKARTAAPWITEPTNAKA